MRKRAYRSLSVKSLELAGLPSRLSAGPVWLGVDIGKSSILAVLRDSGGRSERPWKVQNPSELRSFVAILQGIHQQHELTVAMESTGTYGDALRQCLSDAALRVERVSGKAVSDYSEVFDGVPIAHDGKDAAVIAELAALGKSSPWPLTARSAMLATLQAETTWLDIQQGILKAWLGRLEGLLARHWPELTALLSLNRLTLLRLLAHYGGPAALIVDEGGAARLAGWGGRLLRAEKIAALLVSARDTVGVRMDEAATQLMQRTASAALAVRQEQQRALRVLRALVAAEPSLQAEASVVGAVTACILRASVGDPRDYTCGEAYRKAFGLNLKERSSGQQRGELKITKRGPSIARRWLYFAALRLLQQPPLKAWYEAKRQRDQGRGGKAVIAIMRKLTLALYGVAVRGEPFALERLLPGARGKQAAQVPANGTNHEARKRFNANGSE
jgi:transposase